MPTSGTTFSAFRNGIVIGVTQAVILIVLLLIVTLALGNSAAQTVAVNKAIACELAVPADPEHGRDLRQVAQCFTDQGLTPPDFANVP